MHITWVCTGSETCSIRPPGPGPGMVLPGGSARFGVDELADPLVGNSEQQC